MPLASLRLKRQKDPKRKNITIAAGISSRPLYQISERPGRFYLEDWQSGKSRMHTSEKRNAWRGVRRNAKREAEDRSGRRSGRREEFIRRRRKVRSAKQIKNVQLDGARGGKRVFICYNVTDVQR